MTMTIITLPILVGITYTFCHEEEALKSYLLSGLEYLLLPEVSADINIYLSRISL
jgi:hypothetical protein